MYTTQKNVQILIALFKHYNIKDVVVSPGSRNVTFVHSIENDEFFNLYSIVDERSAGYFALGLSQAIQRPVVVTCTSSTACCNYLPAIMEAKRLSLPLIVLTADRDPVFREQLENQMIKQINMYGDYCVKNCDLPIVNDAKSFAYCERMINEILLENEETFVGPVQINFSVIGGTQPFTEKTLPKVKKINRYTTKTADSKWVDAIKELLQYKKVLFVFGENNPKTEKYIELLNKVLERVNGFACVELMSNTHCNYALNLMRLGDTISQYEFSKDLPDLVITFGGNYASELKHKLRGNGKSFKHWEVNATGKIIDTFLALEKVFMTSDEEFFEMILNHSTEANKNDLSFYGVYRQKLNQFKLPEECYAQFFVIKHFIESMQSRSVLHLSILNSIRISNYFNVPEDVYVYANIGAYGIDGSLSTFIAHAQSTDRICYLVIGDLSCFYDLNTFLVNKLPANIRILLVNNYCGGEFHHVYRDSNIENLNNYIAAGHSMKFNSFISSLGFKYMSAKSFEELDNCLISFNDVNESRPVLLEVFTNVTTDAGVLATIRQMNTLEDPKSKIKGIIKKIIKKG